MMSHEGSEWHCCVMGFKKKFKKSTRSTIDFVWSTHTSSADQWGQHGAVCCIYSTQKRRRTTTRITTEVMTESACRNLKGKASSLQI